MMRFHKLAIGLIMAGLIAGLAYKGYGEYKASQTSEQTERVATDDTVLGGLEIGQRAPTFELETIEGETLALDAYAGQQVVLNFWASWCPPCREELPELIEFGEATGIPVLGVNVTKNERRGRQDVEAFLKEVPVSFPVLLDEAGTVEKTYRVVALPTTYVVGPDGVITAKQVGPVDFNWLREQTK